MSDVELPTSKATKPSVPKTQTKARPLPPLDARCPPRRVRHKVSGVVTGWSTLFKKRIGEFEPFYRPGSDEEAKHRILIRRFEARQAMENADAFADTEFSSFADEVGNDHGLGDPD